MSLSYQVEELKRYLSEVNASKDNYRGEMKVAEECFGRDSDQYLRMKARHKILGETSIHLSTLLMVKEQKLESKQVTRVISPRRVSSPYLRGGGAR